MKPISIHTHSKEFPVPSAVEEQTTTNLELAERFNRVLAETVEAMEKASVKYAFIGGIASGGLGRPRSTHDIDLFVMPEEAEKALRALAQYGFRTEKTDPSWLYKGFNDNILVDVIFKSKGEIYLDTEMYQRMITAEFHGKRLRLVSPEDLIIIKAAAHSELTPSHWHDAIALLSHAKIDWPYLVRRARRAPRRILSLLLYAQSNDIWVPNAAIHELYSDIFQTSLWKAESFFSGTSIREAIQGDKAVASRHTGELAYVAAHLREKLAEDPRTNELDIQVIQQGDRLVLQGEVQSEGRRNAADLIVNESFPMYRIDNQIRVSEYEYKQEPETEGMG